MILKMHHAVERDLSASRIGGKDMVCQTERDDGGQNAAATNILLPRLRSRSCKGRAVSPMQWRHCAPQREEVAGLRLAFG